MKVERRLDNYELLECIDEALSIFGQSVKYTVYWRLAYLNSLPYNGILVKPEAFSEGLRSIFGSGATQIEMMIMDKIRERFGLEYQEKENLSELIRDAKRQIVYA